MSKSSLIIVFSALFLISAAFMPQVANAKHYPIACDDFEDAFHKRDVVITSAGVVDTGGISNCKVEGVIGKEIGFAVQLPVGTAWNGRFYMVGNGVYAGSISYGAMEAALAMGYATASTDTGHQGSMLSAEFAYNDRQSEMDYAYRAVHLTAVTAKEMIEAYYGSKPLYSYWASCSTGGRQALMEAQRFPLDFDGIVAGAPVLDFTGIQMLGIWNAQALAAAGGINSYQLPALENAVYAKCDEYDGMADGLIDDPRNCDFDPEDLPICPPGPEPLPPDCFTEAQVEALEKIYGGVTNSAGDLLFPGQPPGAEYGWVPWVMFPPGRPFFTSLQLLIGEEGMRYMAFVPDPGPDYDWRTFDFDVDPLRMNRISNILDATDPDLRKFRKAGGKMIHYHGWNDTALTPLMSVDYYESVLDFMGPETMDFYRLFMVPGMDHCSGGIGPWMFDAFAALVEWVENGNAPNMIDAERPGGIYYPLCPYPKVARQDGGVWQCVDPD